MIKLIAFDMDGTFLRSDNTYDLKRFEAVYEQLRAKEIKVTVISGNQYAQLASFFPQYKEELFIVSENGALIFEGSRLLMERKIATELIAKVLRVLKMEGLDRQTTLCGLHSAYLLASAPQSYKDEIGIYYHALTEVPDFDHLPADDFVKLALLVPPEQTSRLLELLNQAAGQQMTAVSSGHGSIDMIQSGVHKGAALAYLSQYLQIEPEEMMAFGDGGNDLEMLGYVGESYAMANGSPAVKAKAKYQAPGNDQSGVLTVIEKKILS
ncbi:Cof-type HAD-IIB family hydrolase [Streptococcus panodentis]|uniref:HAD family hydrolase n=1 Tax=Streptococcus panodentis TaxID=1581472 RepID=A0ABS5AVW6_9STRE|nr:Cof-type HAD-IIB family hydrolase [Streptococcus panodentis]MBP2620411.1 HAD family hydrolase [Streptococcus panodentis]